MDGTASVLGMLIGAALLPALNGSRGAEEAAQSDIIAGQEDRHDRMTVPVHIGMRGPYRFLLDTAAENTVIASSLASELALAPSGRATVLGIAGSTSVSTVELDEVLLGRRTAFAITAPLLERTAIGADGILGLDSLQSRRVLFDFRHNLIAVDDAKALGGDDGFEIVVRARRRSGQLIVTDATIRGVRTAVVIDTGSEASIGNRALRKALGNRLAGTPTMLDSVTGQRIAADYVLAGDLKVGKVSINNIEVAFADAPSFAALDLDRRPALLLGMRELRAFERVAIDFSKRKILFDLSARF
jgi:predicted aspartyl protease